MRLYYYTAKQWGMKSLWEKRLKIAEYGDLNDPFELLPFAQTGKDERKHIKEVVKILSNGHGVLCFSKSWRSTLMWAHYGDKHKGMCLGFEIEEGPHLTKISYVSKRLPSPIDFSKPLAGVDQEMLSKCLNVKHSGWRYEKEYRLRVSLNDRRDGFCYLSFGRRLQLREVVVGARSTLSIEDVAEAVGRESEADVAIWTARAAHGAFNMCRNRELPMTIVPGLGTETTKRRLLAKALKEWPANRGLDQD